MRVKYEITKADEATGQISVRYTLDGTQRSLEFMLDLPVQNDVVVTDPVVVDAMIVAATPRHMFTRVAAKEALGQDVQRQAEIINLEGSQAIYDIQPDPNGDPTQMINEGAVMRLATLTEV